MRINDERIMISVIGSHGGSDVEEIVDRKNKDVDRFGKTFWLVNSFQISPDIVQDFCDNREDIYCYFILPVNSSRPTIMNERVKYYSIDNKEWKVLEEDYHEIGEVTGKITNSTSVLILGRIENYSGILRLSEYSYGVDCYARTFITLGGSTLCLVRRNVIKEHSDKDRVIAYRAKIKYPYCVYVRSDYKIGNKIDGKKTHRLIINEEILRDLYEVKNMSDAEIGKIYECTEQNIYSYRKKYGIERKNVKDKIIDSLPEGITTIQLACEKYGLTYDQLVKRVSKAELEIKMKISGINCYNKEDIERVIKSTTVPDDLIGTDKIVIMCGVGCSRRDVIDAINRLKIIGEKYGCGYFYDKKVIEGKIEDIKSLILTKKMKNIEKT